MLRTLFWRTLVSSGRHYYRKMSDSTVKGNATLTGLSRAVTSSLCESIKLDSQQMASSSYTVDDELKSSQAEAESSQSGNSYSGNEPSVASTMPCSSGNNDIGNTPSHTNNKLPELAIMSSGNAAQTVETNSKEIDSSFTNKDCGADPGSRKCDPDQSGRAGTGHIGEARTGDKRAADSDCIVETEIKKPKTASDYTASGSNKSRPWRKKKVAMLLVYSGKDYAGMQINPDVVTIESDLFKSLVKAGVIDQHMVDEARTQMQFQRAARTDKGVSAAGQVVSLRIKVENPVDKINEHLPPQIKVIGITRATKGFDSKVNCMARTYMYMLPTYAFAPVHKFVTEEYRVTEEILEKVNQHLALFKGTHNFHNFTSGKKPADPSARRYIIDFHIGKPFVRKNMEFATIYVKGQSFMLHQIRKMIGLTIAIVRGLTGLECLEKCWSPEKVDVPRAPGLGLMLDKCHYDAYNKRYGNDGVHQPIDWDQHAEVIEAFKEEHIYSTIIDTEKEETSMLRWLSTLHMHHFDVIEDSRVGATATTPLGKAAARIHRSDQQQDSNQVSEVTSSVEACQDTSEKLLKVADTT